MNHVQIERNIISLCNLIGGRLNTRIEVDFGSDRKRIMRWSRDGEYWRVWFSSTDASDLLDQLLVWLDGYDAGVASQTGVVEIDWSGFDG